jgi:hypothetical protein
MDPARMFTEGLTPHPELENSLGPQQRKSRSASMSAVGGVSGLIMLALSLAAGDPEQTSCPRNRHEAGALAPKRSGARY